jgi:WD40 repeat protein
VIALAVSNDGIYVGGTFSAVDSVVRPYLAATDADGRLLEWNPKADSAIEAMTLAGDTLYVGGVFTQIGGQSRGGLAALSASETGRVLDWNPGAFDSDVLSIGVAGNTVYVGGYFTTVTTAQGDVARNHLAAFDVDGMLAPWSPSANSLVYTLAIADDVIYVGGAFTRITTSDGPHARNNLAAIGTDGNVRNWNPDASSEVFSLAVAGDRIYAGGVFTHVGGQARTSLAAIGTDGTILDWAPSASSFVFGLKAVSDTVYVAGAFETITTQSEGAQTRRGAAAIDTSGHLLSWDPSAGTGINVVVNAIAVSDGRAYLGGEFSTLRGRPRFGFGIADATGAGEPVP